MLNPAQLRAAEVRCPAFAPPKFEISVERPGIQVDTTKNLAQMRAAAKAGKILHPAPIVGVYVGAVRYDAQIDDTMRNIRAERVCAIPRYVTLKLTLERVIYIPHEFADDPCLRSLSQDHEAKHADADVKALDGARPAFETAVRTAIDQGTRNPAVTPGDALSVLTREARAATDGVLDEMEVARKKLDDAIDDPTALKRLETACGGRTVQSLGDATISQ